jgi:hypothetical protein
LYLLLVMLTILYLLLMVLVLNLLLTMLAFALFVKSVCRHLLLSKQCLRMAVLFYFYLMRSSQEALRGCVVSWGLLLGHFSLGGGDGHNDVLGEAGVERGVGELLGGLGLDADLQLVVDEGDDHPVEQGDQI